MYDFIPHNLEHKEQQVHKKARSTTVLCDSKMLSTASQGEITQRPRSIPRFNVTSSRTYEVYTLTATNNK